MWKWMFARGHSSKRRSRGLRCLAETPPGHHVFLSSMEIREKTTGGVLFWTPAPACTSSNSSVISEEVWEEEEEDQRTEQGDDFTSLMDENGIIGLAEALVQEKPLCSMGPPTPAFADASGFETDTDTGLEPPCQQEECLNVTEEARDVERRESSRNQNRSRSNDRRESESNISVVSTPEPADVSIRFCPSGLSPSPLASPLFPHLCHFTPEEMEGAAGINSEVLPDVGFAESLTESYSSAASRRTPRPHRGEGSPTSHASSELPAESRLSSRCSSPAKSAQSWRGSAPLPGKRRQGSSEATFPRTLFLRSSKAMSCPTEAEDTRKTHLSGQMPNFSQVEPRVRFPKGVYKPPKSKHSPKVESLSPEPALVFKSPADIVKEVLLNGSEGATAEPLDNSAALVCTANSIVPEDFKSQQHAIALIEQLQEEHNRLLIKYAAAENTIDRLRLGAKVNLYSDPPPPGVSMQLGQTTMALNVMTLDFPQCQRAELTPAPPQTDEDSSHQMSHSPTSTSMSLSVSSCWSPEPQVGPKHIEILHNQTNKLLNQIQSFEDILHRKKLKPSQQRRGLSKLFRGLDSLERSYLLVRDQHKLRLQQQEQQPELDEKQQQQEEMITYFDPERELEGLIFQCGQQLEELRDRVEQRLQQQSSSEAPPSLPPQPTQEPPPHSPARSNPQPPPPSSTQPAPELPPSSSPQTEIPPSTSPQYARELPPSSSPQPIRQICPSVSPHLASEHPTSSSPQPTPELPTSSCPQHSRELPPCLSPRHSRQLPPSPSPLYSQEHPLSPSPRHSCECHAPSSPRLSCECPPSSSPRHSCERPPSSTRLHSQEPPPSVRHFRDCPPSSSTLHSCEHPTSSSLHPHDPLPYSSPRHSREHPPPSSPLHSREFPHSASPRHSHEFPPSASPLHSRDHPPSSSPRQSHKRLPSSSPQHSCEHPLSLSPRQSHERLRSSSPQHSRECPPSSSPRDSYKCTPSSSPRRSKESPPCSSPRHSYECPPSSSSRHSRECPPPLSPRHSCECPPSSSPHHFHERPTSSCSSSSPLPAHELPFTSSPWPVHELPRSSSPRSHHELPPPSPALSPMTSRSGKTPTRPQANQSESFRKKMPKTSKKYSLSKSMPLSLPASHRNAADMRWSSEKYGDEDTDTESIPKSAKVEPSNAKLKCEEEIDMLSDDHQSFEETSEVLDYERREGAALSSTLTDSELGHESRGNGNAASQKSFQQRSTSMRSSRTVSERQDASERHDSAAASRKRSSRSSISSCKASGALPANPPKSSSSRRSEPEKSPSSSLNSLRESVVSERRANPQAEHRRVLSQDGIFSPETDSGFVGSDSSRLNRAALPLSSHQRALTSIASQEVKHQASPASVLSPVSSRSSRRTTTEPSGASRLRSCRPRRSREPEEQSSVSRSTRHWASHTHQYTTDSEGSESGMKSDTQTPSEYEQSDQYAESFSSLCSPGLSSSSQYLHGDGPTKALSSSQVACSQDAMRSLQAEVSRLKEKLETSLRSRSLLGSGAASSSPHARSRRQTRETSEGRSRGMSDEGTSQRRVSRKSSVSTRRQQSQCNASMASEPQQPVPLLRVSRHTQTSIAQSPDSDSQHSPTVCSRKTLSRQDPSVCAEDVDGGRIQAAPLCPPSSSPRAGQSRHGEQGTHVCHVVSPPACSCQESKSSPAAPAGGTREASHSCCSASSFSTSSSPSSPHVRHCPLCGRSQPWTKSDCHKSSTRRATCQAESLEKTSIRNCLAATSPPALLPCVPLCPDSVLWHSQPALVSPIKSPGSAPGPRDPTEPRRRSASADEQRPADTSMHSDLDKAVRAAVVMKHTTKHMVRALAAGLHYQELLSQFTGH